MAAIQEIRNRLKATWQHCPGALNPADLASRGADVKGLKESGWFTGPGWLREEADWPRTAQGERDQAELESETKVRCNVTQVWEPWWERLSGWKSALGGEDASASVKQCST